MPVTTPYRITPNLGPDVYQVGPYYWAEISETPSYQLGTKVIGNDGHEYIHLVAGADFEADDGVNFSETTWVASLDESAPVWAVVSAVAEGEPFHARRILLPNG
jgi:hypothetical protein